MVFPAGSWPYFTSSVFAAVCHTQTVATICSRENSTGKCCDSERLIGLWSTVFITNVGIYCGGRCFKTGCTLECLDLRGRR